MCTFCNMYMYSGIILIRRGQRSWIIKILLDCWDVISWITGLLHFDINQVITFHTVCGNISSREKLTQIIYKNWSHIHNDDSTVLVLQYKRVLLILYPFGGVEHDEVQWVPGQLPIYDGQGVTGSHTGDEGSYL